MLCNNFQPQLSGVGPVNLLEEKLRSFFKADHVLLVASGTAAIHAAMIAARVSIGDEVIVPVLGWGGSIAPIFREGAIPVFVDVESNLCINPADVEIAISPKTKAILAVRLFGNQINSKIYEICKKYNIALIEDCAQAFFSPSDACSNTFDQVDRCYSLGSKGIFGAAEGGCIVTDNTSLYRKMIWETQHPIRQARELAGAINPFALNMRIDPYTCERILETFSFKVAEALKKIKILNNYVEKLSTIPGLTVVNHSSLYNPIVIRLENINDNIKVELGSFSTNYSLTPVENIYPLLTSYEPLEKYKYKTSGEFENASKVLANHYFLEFKLEKELLQCSA